MGYAYFVPLVAGYIIWLDRERILEAPVKPYWPAMALVVWGFLQMLLGLLAALSFVSRTAFVISMAGVVGKLPEPPRSGRCSSRSFCYYS